MSSSKIAFPTISLLAKCIDREIINFIWTFYFLAAFLALYFLFFLPGVEERGCWFFLRMIREISFVSNSHYLVNNTLKFAIWIILVIFLFKFVVIFVFFVEGAVEREEEGLAQAVYLRHREKFVVMVQNHSPTPNP